MRWILGAVGLVVALATTARAGTVTITFETYPGGSTIVGPVSLTTEFVSEGILFDPTTQVHMQPTPSDAPSTPNTLDHGNADTDNVTLDARFVLPGDSSIAAVTPWVEITQDLGANSGNNVFRAYDINGVLVDSVSFNSGGSTFRLQWAAGIHRVFASGNDDLDNLRFETPVAAVPLPRSVSAGLAVLLALAVGINVRRRRSVALDS